jgi:hypothetical protein
MTPAATATRRNVTAFFENRVTATRAVESLIQAGFPRDSVRLVQGSEQDQSNTLAPSQSGGGGF